VPQLLFQVTFRVVDDVLDVHAVEFVRRLPTGSLNHFWTHDGHRARLTHIRVPVKVNAEDEAVAMALDAVTSAAIAAGRDHAPELEVQQVEHVGIEP
jgi:hypothetical protein